MICPRLRRGRELRIRVKSQTVKVQHFKRILGSTLCCAIWLCAPCAEAAETIVAGMIGAPNAPSWPWYIGIEKGFFAEAGITLDLI